MNQFSPEIDKQFTINPANRSKITHRSWRRTSQLNILAMYQYLIEKVNNVIPLGEYFAVSRVLQFFTRFTLQCRTPRQLLKLVNSLISETHRQARADLQLLHPLCYHHSRLQVNNFKKATFVCHLSEKFERKICKTVLLCRKICQI
jgi:hypothetical protein